MDSDFKKQIIKMLREKNIPKDPVEREMKNIRFKLEKEDYKIIKCMESFLVKQELDYDLPYDIKELHETRDELREQINKLEQD